MKSFFRTVAGKVILFILLNLFAFLMVGSVVGVFFMSDYDFYTQDESAFVSKLRIRFLKEKLYPIVMEKALTDPAHPVEDTFTYDIYYELYDKEGRLLAYNPDELMRCQNAPDYTLYCEVETYRDNVVKGVQHVQYVEFVEVVDGAKPFQHPEIATHYVHAMAVESAFKDQFRFELWAVHQLYSLRYAVFYIGGISFLLFLSAFIILMTVSARRKGDDLLHPGPLHKVPYDLLLAGWFLLANLLWFLIEDQILYWGFIASLIFGFLFALTAFNLFLLFMMSTAARIKDRSLLKNTLICRVLRWIGRFFVWFFKTSKRLLTALPVVWKTVLSLVAVLILGIVIIASTAREAGLELLLWILGMIFIISPLALLFSINFKALQKGGKELAGGNLGYKIDTKGMFPDARQHAENLNQLGDGMNVALEQRLKSEHMKTELITNVSHDLKTPLTSIINYASLISQEETDNEHIKEYSEVLVRQSERLKHLIEDLVEASKASTGNLEVELMPCDANIFITQAGGEYEEKLQEKDLTLVVKQPEEAVPILADGRRMWRVFDNLMNNICKYSQPGTRVYLTLEKLSDSALIIFKNTSKDPLDIPADQLLERFVRGDESRSTEGNGLGLSIAKSLTELQKGTLNLVVDGDLFKAILKFPLNASDPTF